MYDAERDVILESYRLKVLRLTNSEVMEDFEAVCRKIDQMRIASYERGI